MDNDWSLVAFTLEHQPSELDTSEMTLLREEVRDRAVRQELLNMLSIPLFKNVGTGGTRVGEMRADNVYWKEFQESQVLRMDLTKVGTHMSYRTKALHSMLLRVYQHRERMHEVLVHVNKDHGTCPPTVQHELEIETTNLNGELSELVDGNHLMERDDVFACIDAQVDYARQEMQEMQRVQGLLDAITTGMAVGSPSQYTTSTITVHLLRVLLEEKEEKEEKEEDRKEEKKEKEKEEKEKEKEKEGEEDRKKDMEEQKEEQEKKEYSKEYYKGGSRRCSYLFSLCPLLLELRTSILKKEWQQVVDVALRLRSTMNNHRHKNVCVPPETLKKEVREARRAAAVYAALEALDDALVNGGAMMTPDGFLDTSTLVVGALENGMARGTTLEADDNTDVRVDRLMAAASLVYRLRQLLRQSKEEEKEKEQRQGKVVVDVLWVYVVGCCGL